MVRDAITTVLIICRGGVRNPESSSLVSHHLAVGAILDIFDLIHSLPVKVEG